MVTTDNDHVTLMEEIRVSSQWCLFQIDRNPWANQVYFFMRLLFNIKAYIMQSRSRAAFVFGSLAAIILFFRKIDGALNPQFWAEDGVIFYTGAYYNGLAAVATTYGGYVQLLPRLVGWLTMFADPLYAPAIFNYAAFFIQVGLVASLFSSRISLPYKPALALIFALVPHTGEVFFSLTNIQWSLAVWLVLLAISEDPRTRLEWMYDLALLIISGLSGPFSVFLLPVFGLRAAFRKTRASFFLLASLAVMAGIQACCLFTHRDEFVRHAPVNVPWLLSTMSYRLYGTFWAGYRLSEVSTSSLWWILLGTTISITLGYFGFRRSQWSYPRYIISASWLCLTLPVGIKFLREAIFLKGPIGGDRYFFIPHVLTAWLIVITINELQGWKRLIPAAALITAIIANIPSLRSPPLPNYHWARYVQPLREGRAVHIPINPEGWSVDLDAKKPSS